jgi:hypothetical protein
MIMDGRRRSLNQTRARLLVTLAPEEVILDGEAGESRTILMYKGLGEFEKQ